MPWTLWICPSCKAVVPSEPAGGKGPDFGPEEPRDLFVAVRPSPIRSRSATLRRRPGVVSCNSHERGALSQAEGKERWRDASPLAWDGEVKRFHAALEAFDGYLASDQPLHKPAERMFQGAIADALTHTGQITLLRRLAGSNVRGENYSRADIRMGRVGPEQPPPPERSEFD